MNNVIKKTDSVVNWVKALAGISLFALIMAGVGLGMFALTGHWIFLVVAVIGAGVLFWLERKSTRSAATNVQGFAGLSPETNTLVEQIIAVLGLAVATFGWNIAEAWLDKEMWMAAIGLAITLIARGRDLLTTLKLART